MSAGTWSPLPSPDVDGITDSSPADEASPSPGTGWEGGASRRFVALAAARALTQAVGLGWFIMSARLLDDGQFGLLATGLTFFALFAGIGDLGMTRTIVRHVAGDPSLLWPAMRHTSMVRIVGGLVTAGLVVAALFVFGSSVSLAIVALAGLIATASGITELGYAALRSTGFVVSEVRMLVAERVAFVAIAFLAIHRGHGAWGVLIAYLATNSASAAAVTLIAWRRRSPNPRPMPALVDRQSRFTAAEFALATLSPRSSPLLLTLFAAPATVGVFVAAQRPIEAISLLALSTAAPVLPIVRSRLVAGRPDAESAATSVVGALSTAMVPLVCWFVVAPASALHILFGSGRYPGAELALRLLAVTALTWSFRGVAEFVLLARDRAHTFLWILAAGTICNLGLGAALVAAHGAAGVAIATLTAELLMTALLVPRLWHVGRGADRAAAIRAVRLGAPTVALAVVTGSLVVLARSSSAVVVAVVGLATLAAIALAADRIRALDGAS